MKFAAALSMKRIAYLWLLRVTKNYLTRVFVGKWIQINWEIQDFQHKQPVSTISVPQNMEDNRFIFRDLTILLLQLG